jgi:hypothetical protein
VTGSFQISDTTINAETAELRRKEGLALRVSRARRCAPLDAVFAGHPAPMPETDGASSLQLTAAMSFRTGQYFLILLA